MSNKARHAQKKVTKIIEEEFRISAYYPKLILILRQEMCMLFLEE